MELTFTSRKDLAAVEWDRQKEEWRRAVVDRDFLKTVSERSTWQGLWRVALLSVLVAVPAVAAVLVAGLAQAQPAYWALVAALVYVYWFFFGFITTLGHELQHKTVFGKKLDWLNEALFFVTQVLTWNAPRHARIGHRLHHRYTMVRGKDPETPWPEVLSVKWLNGLLANFVLRILLVGAIGEWFRSVWVQLRRVLGIKDAVMKDFCTEKDVRAIRWQSLAILLVHAAAIACAVVFRDGWILVFVTFAWQVGMGPESFWHYTQHIGRAFDVNDQRLATRSIRVSPLIRAIYFGMDDHVDHHEFPVVPSFQLPKLHAALAPTLPEHRTMLQNWREIYAIAREKEQRPDSEYVPVEL